MKRTLLPLALGAVIVGGAFTSSAAASGPEPPGKHAIEVECEGIGSFTVTVPRNEHNKGVGQAVAQHLHGIPTSNTFRVIDVSKGSTELFGETETKGGGNANHNQSTTTCRGAAFEAEAEEFFEGELPQGVLPGDLIRAEFETQVVIKS